MEKTRWHLVWLLLRDETVTCERAGGKAGKHYACQGNILKGEEVVAEMAKAFEESKGPLAWRLMAAGEKAGGDKRGKQSAAILRHLREGPKTLRQLYFDMGGTMDREAIRWRLNKAREAGLAELNGTEWSLVPLPQSPDQHLTSNLSEAIPTT